MGRLVKEGTGILVSPEAPAVPGVAPLAFWLYATPPPLGYAYNQLPGGKPSTATEFDGWMQLRQEPTETTIVTFVAGNPNNTISYTFPLPLSFYGPIQHMSYVVFPDVAIAPNGYPLIDGPARGYFDVPTLAGVTRVWGDYAKDARGVWLRIAGDALPADCTMGGTAGVVMLADFPGRAAVAATPAVYHFDDLAGWNAGANSDTVLDGDVYTTFSVAIAAAGAVGFAAAGARDVGDPGTLSHSWYFDADPTTGRMRATPMEYGRAVAAPVAYAASAVFEIRRQSGAVAYLLDATTMLLSNLPSGGPLMVGAALYRAQDAVL